MQFQIFLIISSVKWRKNRIFWKILEDFVISKPSRDNLELLLETRNSSWHNFLKKKKNIFKSFEAQNNTYTEFILWLQPIQPTSKCKERSHAPAVRWHDFGIQKMLAWMILSSRWVFWLFFLNSKLPFIENNKNSHHPFFEKISSEIRMNILFQSQHSLSFLIFNNKGCSRYQNFEEKNISWSRCNIGQQYQIAMKINSLRAQEISFASK